MIRVEAATKFPGELYFSFDERRDAGFEGSIPGFVVTGRIHDYKMHLPEGVHKMTAHFEVNEADARAQYEKELADAARQRKRRGEPEPAPDSIKPFALQQGAVDYFEVLGPYNPLPPPKPEGYKRIFVCAQKNDACAQANLENLAKLAWRRPVTAPEVRKLTSYVKMAQQDGEPFEKAMEVGVEAILISPYFLFRMERDPAAGGEHRIGDYELASRLSYFLWSSMPDAELFRLAKEAKLHDPAVLAAQVARMLKDRKSDALVQNFGGQGRLQNRAI